MNYIYIAQSLDGYIAGPNGELDWLASIDNPEGDDFGFAGFMAGIDAIVMGRNTFEKVQSFGNWPYEKPVFVLSHDLTRVPAALDGKVSLMQGNPTEVEGELKRQGFHRLYIDGGQTIQQFLRAGLINELIVTTIPVLLGKGIPLFGSLDESIKLELLHSQTLLGQLVMSRYRLKDKETDG